VFCQFIIKVILYCIVYTAVIENNRILAQRIHLSTYNADKMMEIVSLK